MILNEICIQALEIINESLLQINNQYLAQNCNLLYMFLFKTIPGLLVIFSVLCFLVFSPVKIIAQNFDDDPLMLEGDDEFGFEQFTDDDFQSSDLAQVAYKISEFNLGKIA